MHGAQSAPLQSAPPTVPPTSLCCLDGRLMLASGMAATAPVMPSAASMRPEGGGASSALKRGGVLDKRLWQGLGCTRQEARETQTPLPLTSPAAAPWAWRPTPTAAAA